ncbi:hypothetical protein H7J07_05955 [Mycobacterium koreense]|uniref:Uncharacterized protein n=1 Tax=Mycolicibacillus koreensis TaxID=1069220 RepID=A0A7I7SBR0_9MYCO|nr:hypothetical protein [Mycolicibacillus koreensis]MCV7247770.1 hypothetical protein [Mycolicibacillus koreensis]OSC34711.1 hypothetical protein B8W67_05535 [Mycolicibacillus koreensis]BBY54153.1 hypothetical protein MKOR_14040 [Mycolicibacillus koreensis]
MTAALADLEKVFANGYTPDHIDSVLGDIFDRTGVSLVCVWEFIDGDGCGGDSQLYVLDDDGENLYELVGDLWPWLLDGKSEAPGGPGEPPQWKGKKVAMDLDAMGGEGQRNLAIETVED